MEINKQTIKEFSKLLIEFGGFYKLKDDNSIVEVQSGEPVAIAEGKHNYPLVLFEDGLAGNPDVRYLNPFSETLGVNRDKEWFFSMLSKSLAGLIKGVLMQTIINIVEKNDESYSQYKLMTKLSPFVDDKTIDEINSIQLTDILEIFYNKSRKTAEAQCAIFTEDYKAAHHKFRKKTWDALTAFYTELFTDTAINEIYKYKSECIGVPETDAKLHIIIAVARDIEVYVEDFLNIKLNSAKLLEHLENIDGYAKLYSWAMVRKGSNTNNQVPNVTPISSTAPANPVVGLPSIPKVPFVNAAPPVVPNGGLVNAAFVQGQQPNVQQQPAYQQPLVDQYGRPIDNYGRLLDQYGRVITDNYGNPLYAAQVPPQNVNPGMMTPMNRPVMNAAMMRPAYQPQPAYAPNGYMQPMQAPKASYNPITGYQPAPSPPPLPIYQKPW